MFSPEHVDDTRLHRLHEDALLVKIDVHDLRRDLSVGGALLEIGFGLNASRRLCLFELFHGSAEPIWKFDERNDTLRAILTELVYHFKIVRHFST
jgi:hypothetical protein